MTDIQSLKQRLLQMKQEHNERIQAIDRDIRHEGMSADWSEQATERENDEVLESLGNAAEQELVQINAALQRIESGEYQLCESCGAEIPEARLELLPFTTLCVNCAEQREQ